MADKTEPLTEDQKGMFQKILDLARHEYHDAEPAVVSILFDGEPAAVLAAVIAEDDQESTVEPVAILVDEALFARMTSPEPAESVT